MFLEWSIMGVVGVGTFMLLHALMSRSRGGTAAGPPRDSAVWSRSLRPLVRLAGWTTVAMLLLLIGSGWSGVWQVRHLTGYVLMIHVVAGVVFAPALAAWVVLTAGRYPLVESGRSPCGVGWTKRLCFWIMVGLSLPLILSIALNLFPLFPQTWQQGLAQCHRYSALGFVLAAWGYLYLVWRTEWRKTISSQ